MQEITLIAIYATLGALMIAIIGGSLFIVVQLGWIELTNFMAPGVLILDALKRRKSRAKPPEQE